MTEVLGYRLSEPYRTVLVGEWLPKVDPPAQQCLFCDTRWGWVRRQDLSYWGVLHQASCSPTHPEEGTT